MSYILEALKKSEYIRQQGRVPDLASLPASNPPAAPQHAANRLALWGGAALLLGLALSGWWRPGPVAPAPSLSIGTGSLPPAASPTPSASEAFSAARTVEPLVTASERTANPAETSIEPPPSPAPVLNEPAPTAPPQQAMQPLPATQAMPLPPLPAAATLPADGIAQNTPPVSPAPVAADAPLPKPPSRVLSFHELPQAVRTRIPTLKVSGFSYAEQADQSLAVINDQVLRQGESPAPGLTLERIVNDGVVLSFAGYRFRPPR